MMNRVRRWGLLGSGLGLFLGIGGCRWSQPQSVAQSLAPPVVIYRSWETQQAVVHLLRIPAHASYRVVPAVQPQLTTLADWVKSLKAKPSQGERLLAAINAGFFDPSNQLATAYVVIDGKTVADPQHNPNLIQNPGLKPYLPQVLNRSEFRRYRCGKADRFDITVHGDAPPTGCLLQDALGAGPRLLPEITAQTEAFVAERDGVRVRDPIGVDRPNARSAIALTANQEILWMMVAQKPMPGQSGMTLAEMQTMLKIQGAVSALNLDGGSSSGLFCLACGGKTWYGKRDQAGQVIQRPIKSALLLFQRSDHAATATP